MRRVLSVPTFLNRWRSDDNVSIGETTTSSGMPTKSMFEDDLDDSNGVTVSSSSSVASQRTSDSVTPSFSSGVRASRGRSQSDRSGNPFANSDDKTARAASQSEKVAVVGPAKTMRRISSSNAVNKYFEDSTQQGDSSPVIKKEKVAIVGAVKSMRRISSSNAVSKYFEDASRRGESSPASRKEKVSSFGSGKSMRRVGSNNSLSKLDVVEVSQDALVTPTHAKPRQSKEDLIRHFAERTRQTAEKASRQALLLSHCGTIEEHEHEHEAHDEDVDVTTVVELPVFGKGCYPCIDISSWTDPNYDAEKLAIDRERVVMQLMELSCSGAGSFTIRGYGLPSPETYEMLDAAATSFFERPLTEKKKYATGMPIGGYAVFSGRKHVKRHDDMEEVSFTPPLETYSLLTPMSESTAKYVNRAASREFQQALDEFIDACSRINLVLHEIFACALFRLKEIKAGSPQYFNSDATASTVTAIFRTTYFPEPGEEQKQAMPDSLRAMQQYRISDSDTNNKGNMLEPHSDGSSLTLRHFSSDNCLEEIRDGTWYRVPASNPGELHVTIGQVMQMWSNDAFPANIHRKCNVAIETDAVTDPSEDDASGGKGLLSHAYFCLGGGAAVDVGVDPICAEGEIPIYPKIGSLRYFISTMRKSF